MKYYLFFAFLNMLQNATYLCSLKSMKKNVGTYLHSETLYFEIDIKTMSFENTEDILVLHAQY